MDIMNVAEAKQQFSRLVDQAAQGATIIIAKAGTPVAKIVPLDDKPKKVVFGTAADILTPEIVEALEQPLPESVLAAFRGR